MSGDVLMILAALTPEEIDADPLRIWIRKGEKVWIFHNEDETPEAFILSIRGLTEEDE